MHPGGDQVGVYACSNLGRGVGVCRHLRSGPLSRLSCLHSIQHDCGLSVGEIDWFSSLLPQLRLVSLNVFTICLVLKAAPHAACSLRTRPVSHSVQSPGIAPTTDEAHGWCLLISVRLVPLLISCPSVL